MRSIAGKFRCHPFLYPAGAFGSLIAALGVVACINMISSNRLNELTGIDRTAFSWNARGADNSDIAGAYICFTHGEYEKSLSLLDRHLRLQPDDDLAPFVHYTAGAVCLIASKRSYFDLIQAYDGSLITEALQHLSSAEARSTNRRLLEESRFLRAKALLMINRPLEAVAELDTVRSLNGPRSDEAMQMIERIHAITP
jgi:outer membrane protein assembly factor BamD (BamD/ComL family)